MVCVVVWLIVSDRIDKFLHCAQQGNFTNPLTREPLSYSDCVMLDEYLEEHIYKNGTEMQPVSVKEAWLLRDSIRVKVGDSSSSDRLRAESLRNEAAVALRGLFVFGHRNERPRPNFGSEDSANGNAVARAPGGFNLSHDISGPSVLEQDGLRIVDDDEAAFDQADVAAWREVQDSFPHLNGAVAISRSNADQGLLNIVRRTANLTLLEEREEEERRARAEHLYIVRALKRKKERIMARQKAKEEGVRALNREKETLRNVDKARAEIEAWRANQWSLWEEESSKFEAKVQEAQKEAPKSEVPKKEAEAEEGTASTLEEKEARRASAAAAKKKAKRKKAKDRAREKKRLERSEAERKERALALQKEKEASALKCGSCSEGIIGNGFEKVS